MRFANKSYGIKLLGLTAILVVTISILGCISSGSNKENSNSSPKTLTEADYKAMCKEIPISELTKNPGEYSGQNVKYKGQILVETFDRSKENETNITTTKMLLAVNDSSFVLESGLLPLYVVYNGSTDAFVYDNVTVFGAVYGNDTFESFGIQKKTLPRVDVHYIETDLSSSLHQK